MVQLHIFLGLVDNFLGVTDTTRHRIEFDELTIQCVGYNMCQGCLATAGRSVKNDRRKLIRFNGTVEEFAFTDDMLLPLVPETGVSADADLD